MPLSRRRLRWAYLVALLGPVLVVVTRNAAEGSLGALLTSLTFIFCVLAAGAGGGWKPGMLTTSLCGLAAVFFFIEPTYSFGVKAPGDLLGLVAYIVGGTAISFLCEGLHRAWDRLEERQRELQLAHRRKDEFLATLAHELRNPLAPIRSALEVIRMAPDEPEVVFQARCTMERQLQQMVRLVDDLLDVSRITRGTVELCKERADLREILRIAIETSQPLIDAAAHHFTTNLPGEAVLVEADVTRLAQVFSNLLNNAAKYTDAGGRITLDVVKSPANVTVSVKDDGVGIPEDMLDGVFDLFLQVDGSLERVHGGLGIGLTIVRQLVEMHGGTIEARSPGARCGSEFIVRLPCAVEAANHPQQASPYPEMGVECGGSKRRVLVVDDNKDAADALSMLLRLEGNDVRVAHDGVEALKMAAALRPQVILLDIGLPKMNGFEVAAHIRDDLADDVVLIAVTGWGDEENRKRSKQAGFDHHLTKPVQLETLEELLAGLPTG